MVYSSRPTWKAPKLVELVDKLYTFDLLGLEPLTVTHRILPGALLPLRSQVRVTGFGSFRAMAVSRTLGASYWIESFCPKGQEVLRLEHQRCVKNEFPVCFATFRILQAGFRVCYFCSWLVVTCSDWMCQTDKVAARLSSFKPDCTDPSVGCLVFRAPSWLENGGAWWRIGNGPKRSRDSHDLHEGDKNFRGIWWDHLRVHPLRRAQLRWFGTTSVGFLCQSGAPRIRLA